MRKLSITIGAALGILFSSAQTNNIILSNNANSITGNSNTVIGANVGSTLTTGNENTLLGSQAGIGIATNNGNTFIGYNATGSTGLNDAGAIGHNALVTASNNLILGSEFTRIGIGLTEGPCRLNVARAPLAAFPDWNLPRLTNYNQTCTNLGITSLHEFAALLVSQMDSPVNGGLFSMGLGSQANSFNGGVIGLGLCDAARRNTGVQGSAAGIDAVENWGIHGDAIVDEGYLNIAVIGIMGDCSTPCDVTRVNYGVYGECPAACPGGGTGYAGYFNGDVFSTGSYLPSDAQFKSGIRPMNNSLDKIRSLQLVQYNYKKSEYPQMSFDDNLHMGVLAQQLEKVLPDLVKDNLYPKTERNGQKYEAFNYKSVNYVELIPIALQAIQELDKKLEALKNADKGISTPNGSETVAATGTRSNTAAILNQNTPNPAASETVISYYIPNEITTAMIMIVDLKGEVKMKFDNPTRGNAKVQINAGDLEPGTYFYSLFCDNEFVATRKMILLGK